MLFKDSKTIREFAEFTNETNFGSIKRTLLQAEEMYIIPELGEEQYDELNDAYNDASDESNLAARLADLLEKCRGVLGPMLVYLYAPKGEIKLDDSGLRREETPTSKSAFQYQVANFREAALSEGEAAIEILLAFLNKNVADYPLWQGNESFKEYNSFFIKDAKTFQKNFHTNAPHRIFRAIAFKMFDVEELVVRPKITIPVYRWLKNKQLAGTPFTDAEKELIKMLQKSIAYFTVAYAIPFLRVKIDGNGLTVMAQRPGGNNEKENTRTEAGDTAVSNLIISSRESGSTWLKEAFDFMAANATLFPAYTVPVIKQTPSNNDCYTGSYGLC